MCWNKQVSLVTFVIAIFGVVYLWQRNQPNDRWIAVFAATIALIQLAEFFMWSDLHCGSLNKYAAIFALVILAAEPFMNMIGGIYFSNSLYKQVLRWMLVAYVVFIAIVYLTQIYQTNISWCGTSLCGSPNGFLSNKSCNLRWLFMENISKKAAIIWTLFLLVPFLTMTPKSQGIILFILGFGSLVLASAINNAAIGSLWCWFGISIILYKILVP